MDPMDTESKKVLEETYKLVQENNKMLHKIRSIQKWAAFWSTLKWLVVVGITLGSLYYLQPYVTKVMDVYDSIPGLGAGTKK